MGLVLAGALLPILILGVIQSSIAFRDDAEERRTSLAFAAERSAAAAAARLQSATILLTTLTPAAIGVDCAPRLRDLKQANPGFVNLIRLSASGRVQCAADTVLGGRERAREPWFQRLAAGEPMVVDAAPSGRLGAEPAVLAATRATDAAGRFDGAAVALIRLQSLRPVIDRATPAGTEVALTGGDGRLLTHTRADVFGKGPQGWAARALQQGNTVYYARTPAGERRLHSVSPLLGRQVFVVLSAPAPGALSWARLNPLSSVIFPLLSFGVALAAVWFVADRSIARWLRYLERVASIYARGRFNVRPIQAEYAPPEIRTLARTLDAMAEHITERDLSLHESLAQKDALMREIHHRVKNNLQVISSLLNMQQRALADPAARTALSDTRQRISALALIYRSLYQGPSLKRVDLKPFLEELVSQTVSSDHEHAAVRTELSADPLSIDPDKLAPVALFAVEAITNAQKHAFETRGGKLTITFRIVADEARLDIADDGPGGMGDGVGRTLMTAFARQLRGRAEFEANAAGGLTASLIFPRPGAEPLAKPADTVKLAAEEPGSRPGVSRAPIRTGAHSKGVKPNA